MSIAIATTPDSQPPAPGSIRDLTILARIAHAAELALEAATPSISTANRPSNYFNNPAVLDRLAEIISMLAKLTSIRKTLIQLENNFRRSARLVLEPAERLLPGSISNANLHPDTIPNNAQALSPEAQVEFTQAVRDLNEIAPNAFTDEDRAHFAQHLSIGTPGSSLASPEPISKTKVITINATRAVPTCPTLKNPEHHLEQTCKQLNITPELNDLPQVGRVFDPTLRTEPTTTNSNSQTATPLDPTSQTQTQTFIAKPIIKIKKSHDERLLAFKARQAARAKPPP